VRQSIAAGRVRVKLPFGEASSGNHPDVLLKHRHTANFSDEAVKDREAQRTRRTQAECASAACRCYAMPRRSTSSAGQCASPTPSNIRGGEASAL
jgi:hypothetical protein